MKLSIKTTIAAVMITGALVAGNVTAKPLGFAPEFNGSSIEVVIKDGVATIYGSVDSGSERAHAKRLVSKLEGVNQVIDLVTYN